MFEDAAGRELMRLQAEKDFTGLVKNDARMNIQHDRTINVGNNDSESVFKDQTVKVGQHRKVRVKETQQHSIGKDIIAQSVEGRTLHMSKEQITHYSEKEITLAVGDKSFITITSDKIVIQSALVHINPGAPPITKPEQPTPIADATQITGFIGAP
jgi:type VI secretion system secreted protein VgrG